LALHDPNAIEMVDHVSKLFEVVVADEISEKLGACSKGLEASLGDLLRVHSELIVFKS
jgi:hypothetical protein